MVSKLRTFLALLASFGATLDVSGAHRQFSLDKSFDITVSAPSNNAESKELDAIYEASTRFAKDQIGSIEIRAPQGLAVPKEDIIISLQQITPEARNNINALIFLPKDQYKQLIRDSGLEKLIGSSQAVTLGFVDDKKTIIFDIGQLQPDNSPFLTDLFRHNLAHEFFHVVNFMLAKRTLLLLEIKWPKQTTSFSFGPEIIKKKEIIAQKRIDLDNTHKQITARNMELNEFANNQDRIRAHLEILLQNVTSENRETANKAVDEYNAAQKKYKENIAALNADIRKWNVDAAQWTQENEALNVTIPLGYVSAYAATNSTEDMAETVAFILTKPEKFAQLVRSDTSGMLIDKFNVLSELNLLPAKNVEVVAELLKH